MGNEAPNWKNLTSPSVAVFLQDYIKSALNTLIQVADCKWRRVTKWHEPAFSQFVACDMPLQDPVWYPTTCFPLAGMRSSVRREIVSKAVGFLTPMPTQFDSGTRNCTAADVRSKSRPIVLLWGNVEHRPTALDAGGNHRMSLYCAAGSAESDLSLQQLHDLLVESLAKLGKRNRVLVVPPDQSRVHSRADDLTRYTWEYFGDRLQAVLPALGTHAAMDREQLARMFGAIPAELFRVHNWRTDVETLGEVPAEFIREQSEGKLNYAWPAQVNRLIVHGDFDLILSIGQVVPHEVIGMANYTKNILVGTGGRESINWSHYVGAVYGMERIMGRAEDPVRNVLNYASDRFLRDLSIVYVLTVVGLMADGGLAVRGLFIGDDVECFHLAAALSLKVNFETMDAPIQKAVVYLDPHEFTAHGWATRQSTVHVWHWPTAQN